MESKIVEKIKERWRWTKVSFGVRATKVGGSMGVLTEEQMDIAAKAAITAHLAALSDAVTERMIQAGVNARNCQPYGDTCEMVVLIFKAMLAAAQEEI